MNSNYKLSTIIKYKLLIIIGLFVVAVLNGARQVEHPGRNAPVHEGNISTIKPFRDMNDDSFTYNDIYPIYFLERE
ncbi:MAG: hypothetical protein ISS19_01655 [Bacteroidales bacterium]|nr:hypothetical protein [Bacteroidales bacterium]